jgi:hypothetical protein
MRTLIPILLFSAVVGASTLSSTQAAATQTGGTDDPAGATATEVEKLREELDGLRTELEETRALLDETVHYLHTSGKAAGAMVDVLAASEKEGFTFGINPRSREVLLEGWRAQLAETQKNLPGKKAEPKDAEADGKRRTFGR